MAKKSTRIDQVEEAFESLKTKVTENIRTIVAAIALVVIIAGIVTGVTIKKIKDEEKAASHFSRGLNIMLNAQQEEKDAQIEHLKAYSVFNDIISQYPSARSAKAAYFYAGVCSFRLGEYETAILEFETFLKKADRGFEKFRSLAYENIGYAYEQKGNYERALSFFKMQRKEETNINSLTNIYNIARSYENLGDIENACYYYEEFVKSASSGSVFAEIAKIKKETLCQS